MWIMPRCSWSEGLLRLSHRSRHLLIIWVCRIRWFEKSTDTIQEVDSIGASDQQFSHSVGACICLRLCFGKQNERQMSRHHTPQPFCHHFDTRDSYNMNYRQARRVSLQALPAPAQARRLTVLVRGSRPPFFFSYLHPFLVKQLKITLHILLTLSERSLTSDEIKTVVRVLRRRVEEVLGELRWIRDPLSAGKAATSTETAMIVASTFTAGVSWSLERTPNLWLSGAPKKILAWENLRVEMCRLPERASGTASLTIKRRFKGRQTVAGQGMPYLLFTKQ